MRVVIWFGATALAVALTPAPGLSNSDTTDLLTALRHPNVEVRQVALEKLLREAGESVRPRVKRELQACLADSEKAYLGRLVFLTGREAGTRRHAYGAEIEEVRQRLWALLKQGCTDAMRPVYHEIRGYWYPPPEALEADADLARAKTDIVWYTTRALRLGMRLPPVGQRLDNLRQRAHLERIAQAAPDPEKAAISSALPLQRTLQVGEFEVLMLTNEYRAMMGVHALEVSLPMTECARQHSEDMRVHKFFGHHSPVPERKTLAHRARLCGQPVRSENIARRCTTGAMAFWRWFGSPPHHRNMLDARHQHMGVGQSQTFYTQWFK